MLKASSDQCSQPIADLINAIVKEWKIPVEWNNSYIVSLLEGKGNALDRELLWLETHRSSAESSRNGNWKNHQWIYSHWWYAAWFHAWMWHNWFYLHCQTTSRKIWDMYFAFIYLEKAFDYHIRHFGGLGML